MNDELEILRPLLSRLGINNLCGGTREGNKTYYSNVNANKIQTASNEFFIDITYTHICVQDNAKPVAKNKTLPEKIDFSTQSEEEFNEVWDSFKEDEEKKEEEKRTVNEKEKKENSKKSNPVHYEGLNMVVDGLDVVSIGIEIKLSMANYSYLNSLYKDGKFLAFNKYNVLREMDNTFLSTKAQIKKLVPQQNAFVKNVRGLRWIKGIGFTFLSLPSALYSGYQFRKNPNLENGIDLGVGIASLKYWQIGASYTYITISLSESLERQKQKLEIEERGISGDWETILMNRDLYNNPTGPGP
ncbi:MAG: hypothetical protein LBE91_20740 [Tannerella sp.]|jgi:hypothetical protein|nr:hypothetical protein [Tannerella sp.]